MELLLMMALLVNLISLVYNRPNLVEGDIILDRKLEIIRKDRGHSSSRRTKRNLFDTKMVHEHRWKDGLVPYVISIHLGKGARKAIEIAFKEIEKYTCIKFTPWRDERDFMEFVKEDGCFSSIGRQGGRQKISIGSGCEFKNTVIHEILHSLGMYHEQTRLDRDFYVKVLWWNVINGAEKNFETYYHGVIDAMHFPYDYQSATHYFKKDFTKNGGDTIQSVEKPGRPLGNRRGMSKIDVKKIYQFYKCYKRKQRPEKAPCVDTIEWCSKYTQHCKTTWFAEMNCQRTCGTCIP